MHIITKTWKEIIQIEKGSIFSWNSLNFNKKYSGFPIQMLRCPWPKALKSKMQSNFTTDYKLSEYLVNWILLLKKCKRYLTHFWRNILKSFTQVYNMYSREKLLTVCVDVFMSILIFNTLYIYMFLNFNLISFLFFFCI